MTRRHVVKSWPEFYGLVASGKKNFELRRNDRDYQIGDEIELREFEPKIPSHHLGEGTYTGRTITKRISYLVHGIGVGAIEPLRGLAMGYCILQLENLDAQFAEVSERKVSEEAA
jgi:hypothetical protein